MRKMFSEKQIKKMVEESPAEVVKALKGQDINVEGITSKGIANTGALANIGDVAVSGKLTASGTLKTAYEEIPLTLNEKFVANSFGKLIIQNSLMLFVIAGTIPQQESSLGTIVIATAVIPQEYRSKLKTIPDENGNPSLNLTTAEFACTYDSGYHVRACLMLFNAETGALTVYASMPAGTNGPVRYISARVPLILVDEE